MRVLTDRRGRNTRRPVLPLRGDRARAVPHGARAGRRAPGHARGRSHPSPKHGTARWAQAPDGRSPSLPPALRRRPLPCLCLAPVWLPHVLLRARRGVVRREPEAPPGRDRGARSPHRRPLCPVRSAGSPPAAPRAGPLLHGGRARRLTRVATLAHNRAVEAALAFVLSSPRAPRARGGGVPPHACGVGGSKPHGRRSRRRRTGPAARGLRSWALRWRDHAGGHRRRRRVGRGRRRAGVRGVGAARDPRPARAARRRALGGAGNHLGARAGCRAARDRRALGMAHDPSLYADAWYARAEAAGAPFRSSRPTCSVPAESSRSAPSVLLRFVAGGLLWAGERGLSGSSASCDAG